MLKFSSRVLCLVLSFCLVTGSLGAAPVEAMWEGLTGSGEPDATGGSTSPIELLVQALRHQGEGSADSSEAKGAEEGRALIAVLSQANENADLGGLKILAIRKLAEAFDDFRNRVATVVYDLDDETVHSIVRICRKEKAYAKVGDDFNDHETLYRMVTVEAAGKLAEAVDRIASSGSASLRGMARACAKRLDEETRCAGIALIGLAFAVWFAIWLDALAGDGY